MTDAKRPDPANDDADGLQPTAAYVPDEVESTQHALLAPTVASPATEAIAGDLPAVPGYAVSRKIARGGMGVVYAAHDPVFDREVAVKIMHPGQDAGRFVVESKITARLPHPGVPPVYALGELDDGRPFLAMKLIHGHTLANDLPKGDRAADVPRLLGVFEHICQTVGFAHSQGIVHRDLKPANVMVGSFGEVQVMDWGLAKDVATTQISVPDAASVRDAGDSIDATVAGQIKGTPSYMSPEQARGEAVDARSDVFALGGILAAMLTGRPPFVGDTALDTVKQAAAADLSETLKRLDACSVDRELIAVAKRCLAVNPADRFANGEDVAAAVAAYRAGVEDRLRQAERDRAVSEAEAREQRKRLKVQLALTAAVVLLVAGGGAFAWWQEREAADRQASEARLEGERDSEKRFKTEQARQGVQANLVLATDLRKQFKFREAGEALKQAATLAAGGASELQAAVEQAQRELAFVVKLDEIRYRKFANIYDPKTKSMMSNAANAAPEYRKAFGHYGLNLLSDDPEASARRIASSKVKMEIISAVDDWARFELDEKPCNRLLAVARRADPDRWRDRLRNREAWDDRSAVTKLASEVKVSTTPAASLSMLAGLVVLRGLDARPLFEKARNRYPSDFDLAVLYAQYLNGTSGKTKVEGLGALEAARALRPDSAVVWGMLGLTRLNRGELSEAIAALREAVRLDPDFSISHYNLGTSLLENGNLDDAAKSLRTAIKLEPTHLQAHINLGNILSGKNDRDGAIKHFRECIRINPRFEIAHFNLGNELRRKRDFDGAIKSYRAAIRLNPTTMQTYTNLMSVLIDKRDFTGAAAVARDATKSAAKSSADRVTLGTIYYNLGIALKARRKFPDAIAAYKEAVRLNPKHVQAHINLANMIVRTDLDRAIAEYRLAIKLNPRIATAHFNLGIALSHKKDLAGCIAAFETVVKLTPRDVQAWMYLTRMYISGKKWAKLETASRAMIKRNPRFAPAYSLLGFSLMKQGDYAGARAAVMQGARLDPKMKVLLKNIPADSPARPPVEAQKPRRRSSGSPRSTAN
jgi:tetratricopeptide (TPR) repeat protein